MELGGLEVDIDEEVIDKYTRNGQSIGFNGFNSGTGSGTRLYTDVSFLLFHPFCEYLTFFLERHISLYLLPHLSAHYNNRGVLGLDTALRWSHGHGGSRHHLSLHTSLSQLAIHTTLGFLAWSRDFPTSAPWQYGRFNFECSQWVLQGPLFLYLWARNLLPFYVSS